MKITWRELAVDLSGQSSDDLMREWRWLVPEALSLRMVSALGDAFLEDASGAIYWLDTGGAELTRIADSRENFDYSRQEPELADRWFAPQLVGDLLSAGHSLGPGQCFSYKTPLTLGGDFKPDNFHASDLIAHFRTLGKIQSQVRDLPLGTLISSVALSD
ncbi:T6SS immunity protein Tdi1 domain-containing protein [Luteimonas sp. WGS1318]|uniref:T6SS immunity protein Tdi1 domain-containing protein n=1 Tax=Luteimonas sp. WGS1318 TaxID=3366815 RepID=UPI00372CE99D